MLITTHPCTMLTFLPTLVSRLWQDTLRNPTVMSFIDDRLGDSNFTTRDILNFLYTGPEEWREPGMPNFDWRNIFNVADQLIRMFNRYGEVRHSRQSSPARPIFPPVHEEDSYSPLPAFVLFFFFFCLSHFFPLKHSQDDQVHQSPRSAPKGLQSGLFATEYATTIELLFFPGGLKGGRTSLPSATSSASFVEPVIKWRVDKWRVGGSKSPPHHHHPTPQWARSCFSAWPHIKTDLHVCAMKDGQIAQCILHAFPLYSLVWSVGWGWGGTGVVLLERALSVQASQSGLCLQVQCWDPSGPHKQTQAV